MHNPPRRRRRSKRRGHRRARKRRSMHKRYGKRYRRNPGGMLIDMAKQAAPVLVGLYGARLLVSKVGPMVPGVANLGRAANPVLSVLAVLGVNWATKKFGKLAKYRNALLLGTSLNALDAVLKAAVPGLMGQLGMGDYIQMGDVYDQAMLGQGDYLAVGATPIDDDIAMADYIAVGSDGVEEELGMVDQELGVDEELGGMPGDKLGGVSQGAMLAPVPTRNWLAPVPSRSFTKPVQPPGRGFDAGRLYQGVFRGGF